MIETTVVIPHSGSTETLIAVLVQLQMQSSYPIHIYIIDCSPDRSGLRIAKKFCFNSIPISVEVRKGTIYENWNAGIELSRMEHPDASILVINDDVLLPIDAIEHFQDSEAYTLDLCYVPQTPPREHAAEDITTVFQTQSSIMAIEDTTWMCGFCFYLTRHCIDKLGIFDTSYRVWFGDTDYQRRILAKGKIKLINGLYVYHFGGSSYKYQSPEILEKINQDRLYFNSNQYKFMIQKNEDTMARQ